MDPVLVADDEQPQRPAVRLPVFEGPLDLLLHLVRSHQVSIWDIPVATICDQYHQVLREMEEMDLDVAGEYLVCAAWLVALKSRLLLPRGREGEEVADPHQELVERLLEYEKVKRAAAELAGLEEVRRGMMSLRLQPPGPPQEMAMDLEDVDVLTLAQALRDVLDRHQRENPATLTLEPIRYSVREKIVELFELVQRHRSFPLLSHLLTRPERLEAVTFLLAALELVRLGTVEAHQRGAFAEIYVTATGAPLALETLSDG